MKNLVIVFGLSLFVMSCDPCEGEKCGEPVVFEPTVGMVFINQDSLNSIDDSLARIVFNDSALTVHVNTLNMLRNRLGEVQIGLDTGNTSLETEKNEILLLIDDNQADSLLFATKNLGSEIALPILNTTKSTITSGLLLVSNIYIPEAGTALSFSDSAMSWHLPLSFGGTFFKYQLMIDKEIFTIELDYENFTEVDEKGNALIKAKDIQIINHSFDDLEICEENCVYDEASFIFYF